jgi:hypothetical protein
VTSSAPLTSAGSLLSWGGFFTAFFTWGKSPFKHTRLVEVRADGSGLYVDDELVAPRSSIARAYVQPHETEPPTVKIDASPCPIEVRVHDEAEGRALLRALGHDAAHAAVSFGRVHIGGEPSAWSLVGLFVTIVAVLGAVAVVMYSAGLSMMTLPVVLAASVSFVYFGERRATAYVGADGVCFVHRRGRATFVSYDDIQSVESSQHDVRIETRDAPVLVRFTQRHHAGAPIAELAAFVARVREGLDAYRARGEGPHDEWLLAARAMPDDAHDAYRGAHVTSERLFALVEDPSAGSSARASAALMLHGSLDSAGRARIRVAADACASPSLRVALDAVANDAGEDEIARARHACEDEGNDSLRSRRARRS